MARLSHVLWAAAILSSSAKALDYNLTANIQNTAVVGSPILVMCNTTFQRANATGIYTLTPGLSDGAPSTENNTAIGTPIQWALVASQNTIVGNQGYGLQGSLMFSPGKANYLDDTSLGYDACAVAIDPTVLIPNTYLRAQSDNGSALQALDSTCKNAILAVVNKAAKTLVSAKSPALSATCNSLANTVASIAQNPPRECTPFLTMDGVAKWTQYFTLTQTNSASRSDLNTACTNTADDGSTFYNVLTFLTDGYSDSFYLIGTTVPFPVITIYLPLLSNPGNSVLSEPYSDLTMTHTNHANDGSRAIGVLPQPTPPDYSYLSQTSSNSTSNSTISSTPSASASSAAAAAASGISGGAIAGIVIGVIAALALIGLLVFFLMRRRRQHRKGVELTELDGGAAAAEKQRKPSNFSELQAENLHEMGHADGHASELPSPDERQHELPTFATKYEMDGGKPPVELPGSMPDDKDKTGRYG